MCERPDVWWGPPSVERCWLCNVNVISGNKCWLECDRNVKQLILSRCEGYWVETGTFLRTSSNSFGVYRYIQDFRVNQDSLELYKANLQVLPVRGSSSSVLAQLVTPLSPDVLWLIYLLLIVSQRSRGQTMRWIFCIHFTALLVCRLEACHHKHKTNKLGQPSASSNNNNVRTNLNTIGRRKRQTYNNVGSVGRNPTVTNTSPGLRNTRTGSDDGRALEPWSKLYWPLW